MVTLSALGGVREVVVEAEYKSVLEYLLLVISCDISLLASSTYAESRRMASPTMTVGYRMALRESIGGGWETIM